MSYPLIADCIFEDPMDRATEMNTEPDEARALVPHHSRNTDQLIDVEEVLDEDKFSETQYQDSDSDDEYPERGLRAYTSLIGSFLGLIVNLGIICTMGPVMVFLAGREDTVIRPFAMSYICAIYISITYTLAILVGCVFDVYGPTAVLIVSAVLIFFGLIGLAASKKVWHFALGYVAVGFGNGLAMTPLIVSVSHWFKRRRALAMGIATAGGSLGGLLFPFMLRGLYDSYGYDWSMCTFAFVCVALMSLLTCCVRARVSRDIEGRGCIFGYQNIKAVFNTLSPHKLRSIPYIFVILGGFFSHLSLILAMTYFGLYAYATGLTQQASFLTLTLWSAAEICGKLVCGLVADEIGCYNVTLLVQLVNCVATFVLWLGFGTSRKVLFAYAAIAGFCLGSTFSLVPVCLSQLTPAKQIGLKYGFLNFWMGIGCLIGIPVYATVVTGYEGIFESDISVFIVGCISVIGCVFWISARWSLVGVRLTAKI